MQPENQIVVAVDAGDKYSEERLEENKKEMLKIMKEAPIAGVYLGEDPAQWHNFFDFYMKFLKSEIGPRGQCSKAVRLQLAKQPQFYDQVLAIFKMTHKTHIKDIFVQYKTYSPCKEYDDLLKIIDNIQKNEESYKRIMDETSVMYNKIKDGMLEKRGPDYEYKAEIETIREKYREKLTSLYEVRKGLEEAVDQCGDYHKFMRVKKEMSAHFAMWKQADMKVGFQSIEKGDSFEKIVQTYLLPYLLAKSKIPSTKPLKIQSNCRWYPKNLGQIDIAIATHNEKQQKWQIEVLIQCKSRLFDIREAYKQVAVLKEKGKEKLCTSMGILDVVPDSQYFIVTTLPENPFHLPIQSRMKENLEKAGKNVPIDDLKSQEIYKFVKEVFKDELSPLDWFLQKNSDHIIVLKY